MKYFILVIALVACHKPAPEMDVRKHVIDSLKAIYELQEAPEVAKATIPAPKTTTKKPGTSKVLSIEGDSIAIYKGIRYPILTGPKGGKYFMGPNSKGEIVRKSIPK